MSTRRHRRQPVACCAEGLLAARTRIDSYATIGTPRSYPGVSATKCRGHVDLVCREISLIPSQREIIANPVSI
jgi:hypothetical protein